MKSKAGGQKLIPKISAQMKSMGHLMNQKPMKMAVTKSRSKAKGKG